MRTPVTESVTGWFHALRNGNEQAAAGLWDRYFERISNLARRQLPSDAAYGEEDLAASVLGSLFQKGRDGKYPDLGSRDELWALMLVISKRKILNRIRYTKAKRRPDLANGHQSALVRAATDSDSPDVSVIIQDECRRLLDLLEEPLQQQIALMRLDGYTSLEIAAELKFSERTIRRKLLLIRAAWENEVLDENECGSD